MNRCISNLPHRQRGLTAISWIVVIAILGFQGLLAMKVIPVYISDASVKSVISDLATDASLQGMSARSLKDIILKRLKINNIYDIRKEHIKIKKSRDGYMVNITYEPRGTIIGNLDYIITFSHDGFVPR